MAGWEDLGTTSSGGHGGAVAPAEPAHIRGRVQLWAPEADITLPARFKSLPQEVQGRGGPWRDIPRSGFDPVGQWDGYQTLKVQLDLLLDGWLPPQNRRDARPRPVDGDIRLLRRLARKVPALDRPPRVRVIGRGPHFDTVSWWVLDTAPQITEDIAVNGRPVRASAIVVLRRFVKSDVTVTQDRERARALRRRTHDWRKGDTLHALAELYLGDRSRAPSIRAANKHIKRWSTVEPGTKIKIPSEASAA